MKIVNEATPFVYQGEYTREISFPLGGLGGGCIGLGVYMHQGFTPATEAAEPEAYVYRFKHKDLPQLRLLSTFFNLKLI